MRAVKPVLRTFLSHAQDLFFPPCCATCGERLPIGCETIFCPTCGEAWDDARIVAAERASESAAAGHAFVVLYRSGKTDGVPERFIFHLKHKGDMRAFDLAARCLSMGVRVALLSVDDPHTDTRSPVFTYAPRSRAAIRKDGFDQAARIARRLARIMDGEFVSLLRRDEDITYEQKKLDASGRRKNAAASYALRRRTAARVRGRTVVLCDDLSTTGATLRRCRKLLMRAGAAHVVFATVAETGDW